MLIKMITKDILLSYSHFLYQESYIDHQLRNLMNFIIKGYNIKDVIKELNGFLKLIL